jgi:hypothetical protein
VTSGVDPTTPHEAAFSCQGLSRSHGDESTSSPILRLVSAASLDPVAGGVHSPEDGLAGALAIAVGDGAADVRTRTAQI